MALIGKVVAMTGVASLISGNGEKRNLHLGDSIQVGDTIQTGNGVMVDLELANGRVIHIAAEQLVAFTEDLAGVFVPDGLDSAINLATIDTVIKAIEDGKDINAVLEETAAGDGGQTNTYGFGFVDLLRINDDLNNFKFTFDSNASDTITPQPTTVILDTAITAASTTAPVVVTLSSATAGSAVTEGGSIIYTASVGSPVAGSDLVVTLSNGQTITIPVGASSADSAPFPVRADDAYLNGTDNLTVTIQGVPTGGNYAAISTAGSVSNTVVDDADTTSVSLSATPTVNEGGNISYTATLTSAAQGAVTVPLDNGAVIHIAAGQTTGTVSVPAPTDDVYIDAGRH